MPKNSVLCIATSQQQANQIVDCLRAEGFFSDDIAAALPEAAKARGLKPEPGDKDTEGPTGWQTDTRGGVTPGGSCFVSAGPIASALNSSALGGAIEGVASEFVGLGIPETDARHYEDQLRDGGFLISVHTEDLEEIRRARLILDRARADHISSVRWSRMMPAQIEMASSDYAAPLPS